MALEKYWELNLYPELQANSNAVESARAAQAALKAAYDAERPNISNKSLGVEVDALSTSDTTPELTGSVTSPNATIDVTVDGNPYVATNNGDGTWTLADNTIAPALGVGTYDVAVVVTDTDAGATGSTPGTGKLEIV